MFCSGTIIKVECVGPDEYRMRYLEPVACDWMIETFSAEQLHAAGWRAIEEYMEGKCQQWDERHNGGCLGETITTGSSSH